jgi:phosphate transport system permease protein
MAKRKDLLSVLLRFAVRGAALLAGGIVVLLVGDILRKGAPQFTPALFSPVYSSENVSMLPAIGNTLRMAALSLGLAVPLGIAAAIYLSEYARQGNRLLSLIRLAAETLAGVPSVVYGLFGMLFFLTALHFGYSLLAGGCTLAVMVLPLVMRTAEEALLAVPKTYREGAFALGAGRLRTVATIVMPAAAPGILAGVILAAGRIVGETAALLYTAGTVAEFHWSPWRSARTLSVHMYQLSSEGLHLPQAYATAAVLVALVAGLNALAGAVAKRMGAANQSNHKR